MAIERKVGTLIEVTYQARGVTSGLTDVIMEIYDETGAKDIPNFPDVIMVEIGSTGRYKGSFTTDAEGKWRTMMNSVTKKGELVLDFDIVGHNVDSVGDAVATVDSTMAKDATVAKDNTVAKETSIIDLDNDVAVVGGVVATVDGKADGIKTKTDTLPANPASAGNAGDTLESLSDQLDSIAAPDAPPMIG